MAVRDHVVAKHDGQRRGKEACGESGSKPAPFMGPTLRRPETSLPPCETADGSERPSAPGRPH